MQLREAVGGKEVFKTEACQEMLTEHSSEARGDTLPSFVGDQVFNGILFTFFAEGPVPVPVPAPAPAHSQLECGGGERVGKGLRDGWGWGCD